MGHGCCPSRTKSPTILTMTGDLASTVIQAIRHAISSGDVVAPDDVVKNRVTICSKCEHKSGVRCSKCGCFINLKSAVLIAKCPIGKW